MPDEDKKKSKDEDKQKIVEKMAKVIDENSNKEQIMEVILDTRDKIRELGKQMKENESRED
jgi:ssRNA-specific RNase YbeY (16S rRNA maturation enzyme)